MTSIIITIKKIYNTKAAGLDGMKGTLYKYLPQQYPHLHYITFMQ